MTTEAPPPAGPPAPPTAPARAADDRPSIPRWLRVAAGVSWRLVAVAAALYVLGTVAGYLAALVVPLAIALLLAALMAPAADYLVRHRVPSWLAITMVVIGGVAVFGGLVTFVVITFVDGLPGLVEQLTQSLQEIRVWLTTGPLQLTDVQLDNYFDQFTTMLEDNQANITSGALTTAATVGETLVQILLIVFTVIFLLRDGSKFWAFLVNATPESTRSRVDVAGRRGLAALVSYVRATIVVALVDAIGIGIGMAILGVPLAVPLAALVFLGAFVPIIGSLVAGTVAVLIAFVANGVLDGVILLVVVVAVMQLESHLLQPLLLGRAVRLHPLAVIVAITAGLLTGGIAGALLAVPLLAVVSAAVRSLRSPADEHVDPAEVRTSAAADALPADRSP